MTVFFGAFGAGFVVMFWGLVGAGSSAAPGTSSTSDVLVFTGILLMAIGVVGSAAVSMRRRTIERRYEATRRRYQ